jgi:hypothetical protein
MNDQPLCLFQSARRPLYRKENLHLLAEERGAIVEVAWNRSWVSPRFFDDGTIARGRRVIFLFTDRPFDQARRGGAGLLLRRAGGGGLAPRRGRAASHVRHER